MKVDIELKRWKTRVGDRYAGEVKARGRDNISLLFTRVSLCLETWRLSNSRRSSWVRGVRGRQRDKYVDGLVIWSIIRRRI